MNVSDASPLKFWIQPETGRSYEVDLSEFAEGGTADNLRPLARAHWAGDFRGRPRLAQELATYFRRYRPTATNARSLKAGVRNLCRFLDEIDDQGQFTGFLDLEDAHGVLILRWIEDRFQNTSSYGRIKAIVDLVRASHDARRLFWPARERAHLAYLDDVDELGVRRLFNAFKKEAMSIKDMFKEGADLARIGSDPRGSQRDPGSASWEYRENHAWLIKELTQKRLLAKAELLNCGAQGLHKANTVEQKHDGPAYLAPGMRERGQEGIVGKLRWFHPSYHDTGVFLWLFLIGTGWNLATALEVDVTKEERWYEDHPQKEKFKVLHAFKNRADKHVFTLSLAQPEWHPYQIIKFMVDRTAVLRETVRYRLQEAEARYRQFPEPEALAEVERLRAVVRSPWLYHVVNKIGEVNCFTSDDSAHLNDMSRAVTESHGLHAQHPSLLKLSTGDARDAWIGYAYVKSGFNALIARFAAQHSDLRSLQHYLRRRRYRLRSEKLIRRVQDAVFSEIEGGRILDPTRLRLLVERGSISLEQERRLLDLRQRTRLGMGCLDPFHPPRAVDPNHVEGHLCRVQRCTGCVKGLVFQDSLEPLARARAELIVLKRTIPFSSWQGTSFEDEERSLDVTLELFDSHQVDLIVAEWIKKFTSGQVLVHDTFPDH